MHEALSASVVETSRPKGAGEIQLPSASLPITAALEAAKVLNAEPKLSSSRPSTGSGSSAIFKRTSLRSGASRDKPSRDNKDGFVFSTTEIHAAIKRALFERRVSNGFHPVQTQKLSSPMPPDFQPPNVIPCPPSSTMSTRINILILAGLFVLRASRLMPKTTATP